MPGAPADWIKNRRGREVPGLFRLDGLWSLLCGFGHELLFGHGHDLGKTLWVSHGHIG